MILVTGATGFLGAELARQLAAGENPIVCTKRQNSVIPVLLKPYGDRITWKEADMLDIFALEQALEGVTQVYHCAALVSFNPADKKQMIKTNVEGTANLVNICIQNNIRLLHVSSVAAIGEAKPGELTTEENHLEETPDRDGYAISKYESEMEVWRGTAEGLNAVIVNPSIIIGTNAGDEGSGKIFSSVRNGLKYYTTGSNGFVDAEDVAKCMIALMKSDIKSQRYIVSAENWVYRQLFNEIAKGLSVKPPATEANNWMLGLAWRVSSVLSSISGKVPGIDQVTAEAATKSIRYDNRKVINAIGIKFKPVTQSIEEICSISL